MKKTSKRSLNAVLAFILALNMSGCSWFGGDDEEDSKDITKHDEDKDKKKDKDDKKDDKEKKDDEDKETDKVDEKENDDRVIHYTGGDTYQPNYPVTQPSTKPSKPQDNPKPNHPTVPEVVKTDFTKLHALLVEYKEMDLSGYTPKSVSVFQKAMKHAENVLNTPSAAQNTVDQEIQALSNTKNQLVSIADFTELSKALEKAKNINVEEYTPISVSTLKHIMESATSILNDKNTSQTEVNKITESLNTAMNGLVLRANFADLKETIDKAKGIQDADYTDASLSPMYTSLKQAENVLSNLNASQKAVDEANKNLNNILDALVKYIAPDTTELEKLIVQAKAYKENEYSNSSYTALKNAINSAESTLDIRKVTADQITKATNQLQNAINHLGVDISVLNSELSKAKALNENTYTPSSYKVLKDIMDETETFLLNTHKQFEIDEQTSKLTSAVNQLVKRADKKDLEKAISDAKAKYTGDYTTTTMDELKQAVSEAELIYNNLNATQEQVDACTQALESTFSNLVERADVSVLNQKITDANAIDQDKYTDASLVDFNKELGKASELVKDLNVKQEQVDLQVTALTDALNSLVAYVAPNMDAINQAITNAEAVNEDDWSTSSYQSMKEKLDNAKEIIVKKKVTQKEIDQAKDELVSAYNALSVDLSDLNKTLSNAKNYQEVNYTLDSFKVLQDAITQTENFLKNTHTQAEINSEVASLNSAIDQLVLFKEADKTALVNAIDQAKALKENEYTPNSYVGLKDAITNAETVNNTYRATVEEIQTAINTLETAKANLVKRASTTALNQAITEAKAKYDAGYTTASIDALKQAVADAEALLSNANATQSDVDAKTNAITQAIADLIKLGDKTALSNLIDELEALKESDYTPVSWVSASLGSVIDDAKAIRDKTEATETEVNTALDALTNAKAKLVKKADITELETEITNAKAEVSKGYTTQSISDLNDAITTAETVKNNPNASATEVTNALTALKNAISSLRVDVSSLVSEINTAKAVDTTGKKPSTITALNDAIKEAETIKDNASITFEQMNQMIQKLKNAVNGLQDVTDVSALQAKVNEVKALNKADYTSDSYAQLETVLQEAITAISNEDITVDEVTQMIQKLDTAVGNLEYVPTLAGKRKECEKVIAEAYALLNDSTFQGPSNLKKGLQERTEVAEWILEFPDEELTIEEIQQQIDLVKSHMKDYRDNQYDVQGMITQAQEKIVEFKALNPDDYSSSTYNITKYYADLLEERIQEGVYEDIKSAYDWLVEHMEELAPKDTNTYVNEEAPAEVLALLNAERKKQGLGELTLDPTLCQATTIRATEAHEQTGDFGDWAHKRPDGRNWATVLDEVGDKSTYHAENVARGYGSGEILYNAWFNSEGHRYNMLIPEFTKVGISMVKVGEGSWVSYMILSN
ncbi:CAP domain-containing protein [[Clostridium] innocuum]|uniref:CAP domain-containing protein n=1 Tax=Clostridium innocuum TaxID=1522 RepID=UPI00214939D6|nr:CAP domain-containing protein [[Clostridium] innocuum]MCR0274437.1 CAP domain-containing protein [[Clostridium] innocuum]